MDFWRTVEILERRKWLILLSGLMAAALMWGATRLVGSKWLATVDFVSPERTVASGETGQEMDAPGADTGATAMLYAAVVKSQAVTEPVLRKLNETQMPANLLKNIDFVPTGARMYQLQVTDSSPQRAEALTNGLAEQFIVVYHNLHTSQVNKAVQLLETQSAHAQSDLDAARLRYDQYRSQHQIIGNLNSNIDLALGNLRTAQQKRDEALLLLTQARARLLQKQAQLAELPAPDAAEVIASSPLSQKHDEIDRAEIALADLRARYTDDMPQVQQAIAHRDMLKQQFDTSWAQNAAALTRGHNTALAAMNAETRTLKQEVSGYEAEAATLAQEVRAAQTDIQRYKGVDGPLGVLAGVIAEKSDTYNALTARLNSARLALDVAERQNPITIMDRVSDFNPPVNTTHGRTMKLILLAPVVAMLCVSALLLGLSSVDRRLKTVRQAELALPRGILAAIPQPLANVAYADMARVTEMQPHSLHSEAYRFLGLHLLTGSKAPRSIMVLAAKAEQGSTTTITNLGITLAQAGKRVVIVDANIRTAEIHTVFGVDNDFGFTDVMQDPTPETMAQALRPASVPGLWFMTSGPAPGNPWELFRSRNLETMSRLLHENVDFVLYDTASSLMFTDALNLAPIVDGAILCVRAFESLTGTEERLIELLEGASVTVLGSVLNDVPPSLLDGYANYRHYYEPTLPAQGIPVGASDRDVVLASPYRNGHTPSQRR